MSCITAPSMAATPDRSGHQKPRADAAARAQAVKRTWISALWVVLALFAVVLPLLLVFILENSQRVDVSYFGARGHLPLGVALLPTAVPGILLAVIAWFGRGVRIPAAARRDRRT